jgi:hypothetical protein
VKDLEVEKTIKLHEEGTKKEDELSDVEIGFIRKNKISGKTKEEIDTLIKNASVFKDGTLQGDGDKFLMWCVRNGREVPDEEMVSFINRDPAGALEYVRANLQNNVSIWRSWCSYRSGKGR